MFCLYKEALMLDGPIYCSEIKVLLVMKSHTVVILVKNCNSDNEGYESFSHSTQTKRSLLDVTLLVRHHLQF